MYLNNIKVFFSSVKGCTDETRTKLSFKVKFRGNDTIWMKLDEVPTVVKPLIPVPSRNSDNASINFL